MLSPNEVWNQRPGQRIVLLCTQDARHGPPSTENVDQPSTPPVVHLVRPAAESRIRQAVEVARGPTSAPQNLGAIFFREFQPDVGVGDARRLWRRQIGVCGLWFSERHSSSDGQQRGRHTPAAATMTNVSNELVWSLVRRNTCFLYKRNGQTKR